MTDWPTLIDELIAAGVSKAEIARRLDTVRSTVQHWHEGTNRPKEPVAGLLRALHRSLTRKQIRSYESDIMVSTVSGTQK